MHNKITRIEQVLQKKKKKDEEQFYTGYKNALKYPF